MLNSAVKIEDNRNPIIGARQQDGKQKISLYDENIGNRRDIIADSNKVDEFINSRNKAVEKNRGLIKCGAILGGLIGAVCSAIPLARNKELKTLGGIACVGFVGVIGALFGAIPGGAKAEEEQSKLTKEFIKENK